MSRPGGVYGTTIGAGWHTWAKDLILLQVTVVVAIVIVVIIAIAILGIHIIECICVASHDLTQQCTRHVAVWVDVTTREALDYFCKSPRRWARHAVGRWRS